MSQRESAGPGSGNSPSGKEKGPKGPPPWINPDAQQLVAWRDGDIVISVPSKSGTTWTMNIVHQLRSGGDREFADVYAEVPWLELVPRPGMTTEDIAEAIDQMPPEPRRAFKTHAAPPTLPYVPPGSGTHVSYVVICRNPEEAVVSLKPFIEKHTPEFHALWKVPKKQTTGTDFAAFYEDVIVGRGFVEGFFGFVASWWPRRHADNVLMMHFTDMKKDHEGSVRKIARFLGIEPTEAQWETILETTSFPWMKAHQRKFEAATVSPVPVLQSGAMIRRGQAGAAREEGMTPALARDLENRGRQFLPDEAALRWFYAGGAIA